MRQHQRQKGRSLIQAMTGAGALVLAAAMLLPSGAQAAPGDEFVGLWATINDDAVLRTTRCKPQPWMEATSLCITIVYDSDLTNPNRTDPLDCNRRVAQFETYENGGWKDGWAFDVRTRKVYRATLRIHPDGRTSAHMAVGSAGRTEYFKRTDRVPPGCEGKRPENRTR